MSGYYRIEKLGKPGVYVCTDNFVHDAASAAEDVGMPRARIVTVPAADYYRLRDTDEEIMPVAEAVIEKLDVNQARKEVEPFLKDPEMLNVWSRDFFRDVIRRIVFV